MGSLLLIYADMVLRFADFDFTGSSIVIDLLFMLHTLFYSSKAFAQVWGSQIVEKHGNF